MKQERKRDAVWFGAAFGLVLLVALISRAFRDSGRGHGHPYRDNARDDDFISFYDKDAVK